MTNEASEEHRNQHMQFIISRLPLMIQLAKRRTPTHYKMGSGMFRGQLEVHYKVCRMSSGGHESVSVGRFINGTEIRIILLRFLVTRLNGDDRQ